MKLTIKKSDKPNKKYVAIFTKDDGKTKKTYFGSAGMSDYLKHKDISRRDSYRKRHKKDLDTKDPTRAGYLSYYILWGDSTSLNKNIKDYKRKFNFS